jgi:apolipoprotein N-acyltransferase
VDFIHKRAGALLAVFATAALLLAGNGMFPKWPLMWIAFLPVLLFAAETPSWLLAASSAALSMLLGSLTFLYYLHIVLKAPVAAWLVPFSLAAILFASAVLLFRALLQRGAVWSAVLALPAFWSLCEYAGSFVPANGTAGSLAYTQQGFLAILQVASLTGPWGITFLLLLFPAALAAAIHLRRTNPLQAGLVLASALAVIAAAALFGAVRLTMSSAPETVRVALLDTDTVAFAEKPAAMQALLEKYAEQATLLASQGAKIIVMPEKTGLLLQKDQARFDSILQAVADRTQATLVLGVVRAAGPQSFNEARIYTPARPVTTYDKQHLLPPFESNLTTGTSLALLSHFSAPIGVAICKDMDFIHPALDYGRAGIGLLLDPAWDFNLDRAWHGHIAIMRGVEGGYAIAHTAKNGFLTVTDNRGRILAEARTNSRPFTSLLVDVPLHHEPTVFNRFGTWFPSLAGILLAGASLRLLTLLRREKRIPAPAEQRDVPVAR